MVVKKILLAVAVFSATVSPVIAQTPPDLLAIVVAGQSNEEGRAPVATMPNWEHGDRLWMLNKDRGWDRAKHPTHFHENAKGGPSLYTAERLIDLRNMTFPMPLNDAFADPGHYTAAGTKALVSKVFDSLAPIIEAYRMAQNAK